MIGWGGGSTGRSAAKSILTSSIKAPAACRRTLCRATACAFSGTPESPPQEAAAAARSLTSTNSHVVRMSASSFLAALASLALVLALATAQGPECKTGPHPTVLAVQQKCAKGSLLCKQVEVADRLLIISTPSSQAQTFAVPNL